MTFVGLHGENGYVMLSYIIILMCLFGGSYGSS